MQKALAGTGKVKGDIRRDQIVRATFRIIARTGVSSLTTAALAQEAGISEANLYRHFRNKERISLAAVAQVQEMIMKNLAKVREEQGDPLDRLRKFFVLQVGLMEENSGIPRLMFSEELHVHREMRELILKTMYHVSDRLAGFVRAAQREGVVRKDIEPLTTVLMLVAMLQGLAFRWSLGGFRTSLARESARAWKNFEKLIRHRVPARRRIA